jgi:predicted PurR-regulated permease PerM
LASTNPEVRPSQVTLKTVFTVSFGVLGVVALVGAISRALVAVTLIGAAATIAIAIDHAVVMLVRRRVTRPLAIAAATVALLGLVVALGFTLIPPAVDQGRQLVQDAPHFIHTARGSALFRTLDLRFHLGAYVEGVERRFPEMLAGAATPILNALGGLLTGVAAVVTISFLVVFMLVFGGRLVRAALNESRPEHLTMYEDLLGKIYQSIGGYIGGLTLICAINATLTTSFLAIDGVPFFLPLGILSGLSSMVPYAGPLAMGVAISLVALVTVGPWHCVAAGIYFIVYGQLEGNVLGPLIFRRTVHVNPLVTTLSLLFLGEIAGIIGAIVAVPVVATLQIILREILRIRREQLKLPRLASASDEGLGA